MLAGVHVVAQAKRTAWTLSILPGVTVIFSNILYVACISAFVT